MPPATARAVYCDVDGTLTRTTIVTPLLWLKRRTLPPVLREAWAASLLLRGPYWLVLDRLSRAASNHSIYACYGGMDAQRVRGLARECHQHCLRPRLFPRAVQYLEQLRANGVRPVLVSGSLDFLLQPLAEELGAELLAAALEEQDGVFTGRLKTGPLAGEAKAEALRKHSQQQGYALPECLALGDALGDLPMLAAVGRPVAVNAERRLAKIAAARGWECQDFR